MTTTETETTPTAPPSPSTTKLVLEADAEHYPLIVEIDKWLRANYSGVRDVALHDDGPVVVFRPLGRSDQPLDVLLLEAFSRGVKSAAQARQSTNGTDTAGAGEAAADGEDDVEDVPADVQAVVTSRMRPTPSGPDDTRDTLDTDGDATPDDTDGDPGDGPGEDRPLSPARAVDAAEDAAADTTITESGVTTSGRFADGTCGAEIEAFLAAHPDETFRIDDIAAGLPEFTRNTVAFTLSAVVSAGKVARAGRGEYQWVG